MKLKKIPGLQRYQLDHEVTYKCVDVFQICAIMSEYMSKYFFVNGTYTRSKLYACVNVAMYIKGIFRAKLIGEVFILYYK